MRTVSAIVAPQIIGQRVNRVAAPGEIVTFAVVVTDARAGTFQWKFNGTDIPGATGDSLLLTNVNTANEGQYFVAVTNSAGSATSAPAALMLDSDGDGLPDAWEKANFTDPDPTHPLNPANQRSETDPDQDGISNLDEFLDGTDPNDKGSFRPRLTAYSGAGRRRCYCRITVLHQVGFFGGEGKKCSSSAGYPLGRWGTQNTSSTKY